MSPPGPVCPLRFRVHVCMYVHERVSSRPMCMCAPPAPPLSVALMTLAQRKVMTNARYQRTRPMTNGRAPEQPHYAVITEDGWPGAPRPHTLTPPTPTHPAPVTGVDPAPPAREGAEFAAARPPIAAGPETPRPGSVQPLPRRRNKAMRPTAAGGALAVWPA